MNGMSTSTLWPILHYPSCKGPNTATHDQEVDETQATDWDTQQEIVDCVITKEEDVSAIKKLQSRKDTLSVIFNKDVQIKHLPPRIAWCCGTITQTTNLKIETQLETTEALQYS